jgi:hypothetical protein
MIRVTVDDMLREKLQGLLLPLELCDAQGRILARVFPVYDPALYEGLEPPFSREERQRRKQTKGKTYTTAEVLAHLEKL